MSTHNLLCFEVSENSSFAVKIEAVQEIVDTVKVTPYPQTHQQHLGIANIRGQIIPIVRLAGQKSSDVNTDDRRLLVLEFHAAAPFGLLVSRVQKVKVEEVNLMPGRVINIEGKPTRFVTDKELL